MTDTPSNRNEITEMAGLDYSYTELLGLALYGDVTPADLTNGHNFNMRELDKAFGDAREKGQTALEYLEAMGVISEATANALKARVDNADTSLNAMGASGQNNATNFKAKVDNADNSLNVLGASGQNNAAELKKKIDDTATGLGTKVNKDDVYDKSAADDRFELSNKAKIMVWIGDSWSQQDDGKLPKDVASLQNIQLKNYATGGTGYLSATNRFNDQLISARDDPSFDNNDVAIVVIFGGINDIGKDGFGSAVNQTLQTAVSSFPNAKRYAIGSQNGWSAQTLPGALDLSREISRNAVPGVITVPTACLWDLGHQDDFLNSQPCHLNDLGHNVYANKINAVLTGVNPSINSSIWSLSPFSDDNVSTMSMKVKYTEQGLYQFIGFVTPKIDGDVDVCKFPANFPGMFGSQLVPMNVYSSPSADKISGAFALIVRDSSEPDISASPAGWLGKPYKLTLHGAKAGVQYYCPSPLLSVAI